MVWCDVIAICRLHFKSCTQKPLLMFPPKSMLSLLQLYSDHCSLSTKEVFSTVGEWVKEPPPSVTIAIWDTVLFSLHYLVICPLFSSFSRLIHYPIMCLLRPASDGTVKFCLLLFQDSYPIFISVDASARLYGACC